MRSKGRDDGPAIAAQGGYPVGDIIIGSLGGTIAMTSSRPGDGATPSLTAEGLLSSIPGLNIAANIQAHSVLQLPSASISLENMIAVLDWCSAQADAGAKGIVLTQGTDSIEETSWLLDLFWHHEVPLIVTGAMRTPDSAGADGPANLKSALQVAASADSAGRGVLVVMNEMIHAARRVRKTDTIAPDAFSSGRAGALGRLVEAVPVYVAPPTRRRSLAFADMPKVEVALVSMCLGSGPGLLQYALSDAGYAGVVIAGFGSGHVPHWLVDLIGQHSAARPVVICSRCVDGPTTQRTYGYNGSEIDLMSKGAWMGGSLSPEKARILLWALLAAGTPRDEMRAAFEEMSR